MNGWLFLILFALVAVGLLLVLRLPRRLWSFAAATMVLGAAGYAWQGHPTAPGHPATREAAEKSGEVDEELTELREALFGRFNVDDATFKMSDAMTRAGNPDYASVVMLAGVRKYPQDAALWTGLGIKIAEQDGNIVSPASKFAFERAMALSPQHPGPPFFYGVAHLRANDFPGALPMWKRALELTPKNASYREQIEKRLFLLLKFIEMQAQIQREEAAKQGQPSPPAR